MDSVSIYLNEIAQYPLLTAAEEIELGRQVQAMMMLKEQQPDPATHDQAQRRVVRRGERAKQRIIVCNLRLVVTVAKKYAKRCMSLELLDLIQEGAVGLSRAAEKFDPSRGYKFSTYAYWWIRQSINRSIQDRDRVIRLPVHKHEMVIRTKNYIVEQMMATGCTPSMAQCAAALGYDARELQHTLHVAERIASLDMSANNDPEKRCIKEILPDPVSLSRDEDFDMIEHETLIEALNALDQPDRELICRADGLNGFKQASRAVLARDAGVSREAIRQKYYKAINKLRHRYRVIMAMNSGPIRDTGA